LDEGSLSRYAILWHAEAVQRSPIDWSITKDLTVRAHLSLQELVGRELPVQLKLEKRIPVGGGLGGGSSDAAAMLLALREMFGLDVNDEQLDAIAITLGSDVPFFLRERVCLIENLGEAVTPADQPIADAWAVLVLPSFGCGTRAVYGVFDDSPGDRFRGDEVRALASSADPHSAELFNDLAGPAFAVEPRLGALVEALNAVSESPIHVTGSGSTLFALARDEESAKEMADMFGGVDSESRAVVAPLLDQR